MMKSIALFILLFAAIYKYAAIPPQDHFNYTVAIIQHLARQQVGTFKCVFADLSLANPFNGWLGQLLATPALDHILKFVINGSFEVTYENLPHKPSLVVVNVGDRILQLKSRRCNIRRNFLFLDSNTRVLALVNVTCLDCLDTFTKMLNAWQFDKVVYMEYSHRVIFLMDYVGTITTILKHFPPPEELFKSTSRYLQGRGIRFTSKGIPYAPDVNWVQETAKFVNTSAFYLPGVCPASISVFECIDALISTRELDIALDKFGIIGLTPRMYRMLANHEPISEVILVPQSRPFNDIEMFVKPFAWEGWVVMISMLLLIEVMSVIFPALFKNDPILLLVCGFERYNLHEAKTREKIIFLPLMVFFFLMFNAYETKIISFMTNKPTIGKINTLDQLVKSGIKIKVNLRSNVRILNDSVLGPLVIPLEPNESVLQMDGINAYESQMTFAPDMINSLSNYDFKMRRPKYTLLDERRKTSIGMFYVGIISPLDEILRFTQRTFFETGFFDIWKVEASLQHHLRDRKHNVNVELEDVGLLMFDDLICTWIALGVGLLTATVFFCLELVFQFRGKLQG